MKLAQAIEVEAAERLQHPEDRVVRFFDGKAGYTVVRIDADGRGHDVLPTMKRRKRVKAS
jgi:hypothetical protein